ncbi:chromosome partitioning protein ParB [Bacteroidetes bacterium UKL13-3]|jgi:ParB family chromosome partitioning protein|nr:chromosome partitioning protein ParB [Bacteroidetes bacterium UKL13-3]HCP93885.1 chromosome partitioning protein ParB [Bacteroidota bacterium]
MSNPKRNALGRGLSALLENASTDVTTTESKPANSISEILISQIEANPFQPRTEFEENALNELAESIRVHGVIQPITVRKMGYDTYQIISGERRTRASIIAGMTKIPAYVRVANDQEMLEMALIENIQREELNPIEISLSYKRLIDECNLKQDELGERVGKNRTTVNNYLRLLRLPEKVQLALKEKAISMGHARAIINVEDPQKQEWMLEQMLSNELSVRDVESLAREANTSPAKKAEKPAAQKKSEVLVEFQQNLSDKFNTKISIKADDKGRGAIKIPFRSQADLQRILDMLG